MARFAALSLFLFISWQMIDQSTQEREVLIRDRLVLVLCDQIDQYLNTSTYPPPVKKMPEKYKKVKPGQGGASMNGFRVVVQGESKRKRNAEFETPILDFLYT